MAHRRSEAEGGGDLELHNDYDDTARAQAVREIENGWGLVQLSTADREEADAEEAAIAARAPRAPARQARPSSTSPSTTAAQLVLGSAAAIGASAASLAGTVVFGTANMVTGVVAGGAVGGIPGAIGGFAASAVSSAASLAAAGVRVGIGGVVAVGTVVVHGVRYLVRSDGTVVEADEADVPGGGFEMELSDLSGLPEHRVLPGMPSQREPAASASAAARPAAGDEATAAEAAAAPKARAKAKATACTECGVEFSWLLWRYECKDCGRAHCYACLSSVPEHSPLEILDGELPASEGESCAECFVAACIESCEAACVRAWPAERLIAFMAHKRILARSDGHDDRVRAVVRWVQARRNA